MLIEGDSKRERYKFNTFKWWEKFMITLGHI